MCVQQEAVDILKLLQTYKHLEQHVWPLYRHWTFQTLGIKDNVQNLRS